MFRSLSVVLLFLSAIVTLLTGCSTASDPASITTSATASATQTATKTGSGAGTGTASATVTGYAIKVTQGGAIKAVLSLTDLGKLATVTITAGGQSYTGPAISAVLTRAGVTSFTKVTIVGLAKGRLATAELPLTRSQVNDKLMLRLTNQNTYSMASPDIDPNSWVIDVNEVRAE